MILQDEFYHIWGLRVLRMSTSMNKIIIYDFDELTASRCGSWSSLGCSCHVQVPLVVASSQNDINLRHEHGLEVLPCSYFGEYPFKQIIIVKQREKMIHLYKSVFSLAFCVCTCISYLYYKKQGGRINPCRQFLQVYTQTKESIPLIIC